MLPVMKRPAGTRDNGMFHKGALSSRRKIDVLVSSVSVRPVGPFSFQRVAANCFSPSGSRLDVVPGSWA